MKTIYIPIHLDYTEENEYTHAEMYSEGDDFVIKAHSCSKLKDSRGFTNEQYDTGYRFGISFEELNKWLPDICNAIKEQISIEVTTEELPKRHKTSCEESLYCTTYRVEIGNNTVFDKNTYKDGSIQELRTEIVSYIARLVYDYQLFMAFFER